MSYLPVHTLVAFCPQKMTDRMDTSLEEPTLTSAAADMNGSSDKLFCCKWIRNRIPITYREELYHILRMTGPLVKSVTMKRWGCGSCKMAAIQMNCRSKKHNTSCLHHLPVCHSAVLPNPSFLASVCRHNVLWAPGK